ncbi:hypothetical protein SAMN05216242_11866 [Thauera chlorobenzoica]|nr:hypothetical protein SAMN05216242_11866 [Thauera chlorobenzoica]
MSLATLTSKGQVTISIDVCAKRSTCGPRTR